MSKKYVTSICEKCGTEFELTLSAIKQRIKHNRLNYCKKCKGEWYSEIQKEVYKNYSNDRKNQISQREKERWENLSEEDKNKKIKNLNEKNKIWFNNLSKEDKEELYKSRSIARSNYLKTIPEDEFNKIINNMRIGHNKWYDSLTDEQKEEHLKLLWEGNKKYWNNMSDEDRHNFLLNLSISQKKWYDNLSEDEKDLRIKIIQKALEDWKNNLTKEEFERNYLNISIQINETDNLENINYSSNEKEFINLLNIDKIKFKSRYCNIIKHTEFNELFPYNKITGSKFVSPYHQWDFLIKTKQKNILVDVDGSIHDPTKMNFKVPGQNYTVRELIDFNDSQRLYQTDNLDAYIIKAYKDDLYDKDVVVENIKTKECMNLKQFITLITFKK